MSLTKHGDLNKNSKIYISGHTGLAGSAILNKLLKLGYKNLILKNRNELDLRSQGEIASFFEKERPEYVFHAAAKVGNISANIKHPAQFIRDNLLIQTNVIHQAHLADVKRLIFFSSNCAYPKLCPQPMREENLFTGPIEPTNEAYGIAKISGIIMCESYNKEYGEEFMTVIPASLYGPGDRFDKDRAHIIPSLIKNIHQAKIDKLPEIKINSNPNKHREFLFVEDLANASIRLMRQKELIQSPRFSINVGTGMGTTMETLAMLIKKVIGYNGKVTWNKNAPRGMPQKILSVKRIHALGWRHKTSLESGITKTYKWFLGNRNN